jgi:hypothetical protein
MRFIRDITLKQAAAMAAQIITAALLNLIGGFGAA